MAIEGNLQTSNEHGVRDGIFFYREEDVVARLWRSNSGGNARTTEQV